MTGVPSRKDPETPKDSGAAEAEPGPPGSELTRESFPMLVEISGFETPSLIRALSTRFDADDTVPELRVTISLLDRDELWLVDGRCDP